MCTIVYFYPMRMVTQREIDQVKALDESKAVFDVGGESITESEYEKQLNNAHDQTGVLTDRIMQHIPGTAIGYWIVVESLLPLLRPSTPRIPAAIILFVIGIMIAFFTMKQTVKYPISETPASKSSKRWQIRIGTVGFAAWAYSMGGLFEELNWPIQYDPMIGVLALVVFGAVLPLASPHLASQTADDLSSTTQVNR